MSSLTIECVLDYRKCSLTIECVLVLPHLHHSKADIEDIISIQHVILMDLHIFVC